MKLKIITALLLAFTFINCKKEEKVETKKEEKVSLTDGIFATIETNKGTIIAKLEFEKVPTTVANFISLAEGKNDFVSAEYKGKHFYDGLTFHRVIPDFMVQCGDPLATGMGGPGYQFADEFHPDLKHNKPGILSMANSGPGTNGSQFFITHKDTNWLDGKHSVFGAVIKGMDVVNKIAATDVINKITIERKGDLAKKFDAIKTFSDYFKKEQAKQAEINKNSEAIKSTVVAKINDIKKTGTKTKSGLIYKIVSTKNGNKPKVNDQVFVDYAGYLTDGTLFDTSLADVAKNYGQLDENRAAQNGYAPFPFKIGDKTALIGGFTEAIEAMKIGDKLFAIIPPYLGYGDQGGGPIPPKATIVFEIELLKQPKN
jgi:peptidyl-prolyl cis-trans isomerase A (cyclophilin A)